MNDKLMYIPNYDKQNYSLSKWTILVEKIGNYLPTNEKKGGYNIFGTSIFTVQCPPIPWLIRIYFTWLLYKLIKNFVYSLGSHKLLNQ